MLTNGRYVRELERAAAEYLGVGHCVAVGSCTAGLMLVLRAAEISGDVMVPSSTFAATAHAVAWNGVRPVFADIDPSTLNLSPEAVENEVTSQTEAILAVHLYGTPCDVEGLADVAHRHGLRLFFDSAHAFGSVHGGRRIGGFGDAEVFSLSPTKTLVAGEGGLITTSDEEIAERCRMGRDYGNPGDYDCRFVGLSARMSEMHAAIALGSIQDIEERIARRNALAQLYRETLGAVPGIRFPEVPEGDRSTYKDFTLLVAASEFGLGASDLQSALAEEGIDTRRYYSPPVHTMKAYEYLGGASAHLPTTMMAAEQVLTLPLWGGIGEEQIVRVASAIRRIQEFASEMPKTISLDAPSPAGYSTAAGKVIKLP